MEERQTNDKWFSVVVNALGEKVVLRDVNADEYSMVVFFTELREGCSEVGKVGFDKLEVKARMAWSNEVRSIHKDVELLKVFAEYDEMNLRVVYMSVQRQGSGDDTHTFFNQHESTPQISSLIPFEQQSGKEVLDGPQTQRQASETRFVRVGDENSYGSDYFPEDSDYESSDEDIENEPIEDIVGEDIQISNGDDDGLDGGLDIDGVIEDEPNSFEYHDTLLDGYQSGDDSELDIPNVEPACDPDNPHSKLAKAQRGKPFIPGPHGEIILEEGLAFENAEHFRVALRDFRVSNGFLVKQEHNDKKRYRGRCMVDGCPWRIVASAHRNGPTFMVRTYVGLHTCERKHKNKQANSGWIARHWGDFIRANPKVENNTLADVIRRQFGVEVPSQTLYRAKRVALYGLNLEHSIEFGLLRKYTNMVVKTNPGSLSVIKRITPTVDGPQQFQRMFLSFAAQREGFLKGCRPFVGVDGCHLKGRYRGVLLSAVSIDANSGVFPLAFAMVEGENKYSWRWFFGYLKQYLGEGDPVQWTIMTDRQKGILSAVEEIFPHSYVRYCGRHILANIKNEVKEGLIPRGFYWSAVRAASDARHNKAMENLRAINPRVFNYLKDIPKEHWARHAFEHSCKADHVTNNMSETWNSSLGYLRGQPIVSMFEGIRRKVMGTIAKRRAQGLAITGRVPPLLYGKLDQILNEATNMKKEWCGDRRYEVKSNGKMYIVDLEKGKCDCGHWEVSGIPCSHAVRVLNLDRGESVINLIHPKFSTVAFRQTYATLIYPIPDRERWEEVESQPLLPPDVKKQPGRPKNARRKEPGSPVNPKKRGNLQCKQCGGLGHNSKGCKNGKAKTNKSGKKARSGY